LAGSHQTIAIQLPVTLAKFFNAVHLTPVDFFERWKVIGGPPREAQAIFPISLDKSNQLDFSSYRSIVMGSGLGLLEGIDPNPSNIVAAGVLHTSQGGKVGCLLRFEPNKESKVTVMPNQAFLPIFADSLLAMSTHCSQYGRGGSLPRSPAAQEVT
jgi:AP-2 complex subunit alpha